MNVTRVGPGTPSSASTRTVSALLVGSMILASTNALNACLGPTLDHVQQPCRALSPERIGVRSMITVTNLSPRRASLHTCSSTPIACERRRTGRDRRSGPTAVEPATHGVARGGRDRVDARERGECGLRGGALM